MTADDNGAVQVRLVIPAEGHVGGPVDLRAIPSRGERFEYRCKQYIVDAVSPGPCLGMPLVRLVPAPHP